MNKTTTRILWIATALTMSAAPAAAQTTKNLFLDLNAGVQVSSRTFVVDSSPIVFGETAIISTSHDVGSAPLFDVSAGYRVWRDLSIGLGFSFASSSADAAMTAAVPDPLFHDRRVTTTATADGLKHSEKAFYIQALWTVPVTDKMDASFSVGPSFINVSQELVSGITVAAGSLNATPVTEKQSDTAKGFHVGADLSYLLNPRYGVGGFVRYVGGSVGLPSVVELKLGGFQIGGGARLRF
jgi:hypothetical protein